MFSRSIDDIPHHMFSLIFDRLPLVDFSAVLCVNKTWNILMVEYIKKRKSQPSVFMCLSDQIYDPSVKIHRIVNIEPEAGYMSQYITEESDSEESETEEGTYVINGSPKEILLSDILDGAMNHKVLALQVRISNASACASIEKLPQWFLQDVETMTVLLYRQSIDFSVVVSRMPNLKNFRVSYQSGPTNFDVYKTLQNMHQVEIAEFFSQGHPIKHKILNILIQKSKITSDGLKEFHMTEPRHQESFQDIINLLKEAHFAKTCTIQLHTVMGDNIEFESWLQSQNIQYSCLRSTISYHRLTYQIRYRDTEFVILIRKVFNDQLLIALDAFNAIVPISEELSCHA